MAIRWIGQFLGIRLLLMLSLLGSTVGCSMFRSVEQWKCDNLGICQFGTQPTQPLTPPATVVPQYGQPACSTCPPPGY